MDKGTASEVLINVVVEKDGRTSLLIGGGWGIYAQGDGSLALSCPDRYDIAKRMSLKEGAAFVTDKIIKPFNENLEFATMVREILREKVSGSVKVRKSKHLAGSEEGMRY